MRITNLLMIGIILVFSLGCSAAPISTAPVGQPTQTAVFSSETTLPETAVPAETVTSALLIPQTSVEETPSPVNCTAPASLTPSLTEGPYYSPGSPETSSLSGSLPGTHLVLTGYVMDSSCQPVPGTWLDFWQADSQGNYDNQGFTLRGHQFTDDNGHYALETIVPGLYPGRTEHIHVKVQAPDGPILTTQLFFPDVSSNNTDAIFDSGLVIQITSQTDTEIKAEFTFIVPVK